MLLPTELKTFSSVKNAVAQKIAEDEYALASYYEIGVGDTGSAGLLQTIQMEPSMCKPCETETIITTAA